MLLCCVCRFGGFECVAVSAGFSAGKLTCPHEFALHGLPASVLNRQTSIDPKSLNPKSQNVRFDRAVRDLHETPGHSPRALNPNRAAC